MTNIFQPGSAGAIAAPQAVGGWQADCRGMATPILELAARLWWNEAAFRPSAASSARRNAL